MDGWMKREEEGERDRDVLNRGRWGGREVDCQAGKKKRTREEGGSVGEVRLPYLDIPRYTEDTGEVVCERVYAHDGEVWALASSPKDR
jgi:hypothetical protein